MIVYQTKITRNSGLVYQIQLMKHMGIWLQRHKWFDEQLYLKYEDPWIRAPYYKTEPNLDRLDKVEIEYDFSKIQLN